MKLILFSIFAIPAPFFAADCPVVKFVELVPGQPEPVCLFIMADCASSQTPPGFVYGNCASGVCECLDSECDCGDDGGSNSSPGPEPDPNPAGLDPGASGAGTAGQPAPAVMTESSTFELGQSRQFDGRALRPNQALEDKVIRLPNTAGQDPSTDLIKVPEQFRVDLVTSVRFGAGKFFPQEAFFGLFEVRTVAPLTYKVNGEDVTIEAGKKFHIAVRLKEQPATLSNLGRTYRALVRSDSTDSPQEGVITLSDVEYHALGSK